MQPCRGESRSVRSLLSIALARGALILGTFANAQAFSRPFSELPMNSMPEKLYEYACREGNYALPGLGERGLRCRMQRDGRN